MGENPRERGENGKNSWGWGGEEANLFYLHWTYYQVGRSS